MFKGPIVYYVPVRGSGFVGGCNFKTDPFLAAKFFTYKKLEGGQISWHSNSSLTGVITETKKKRKILAHLRSMKVTQNVAFLRAQIFKISWGTMPLPPPPPPLTTFTFTFIKFFHHWASFESGYKPATKQFLLKKLAMVHMIVTSERYIHYRWKTSATSATVVYVALVFRNKRHSIVVYATVWVCGGKKLICWSIQWSSLIMATYHDLSQLDTYNDNQGFGWT